MRTMKLFLINIKLNLDLDDFNFDPFRWMRTEGSFPSSFGATFICDLTGK